MENTTSTIQQTTQTSSVHSIALARFESVSSKEAEDKRGWVNHGLKNDYSDYLTDLFQNVPIHGSLVSSISQYIAGRGVTSDNPVASKRLAEWRINEKINEIALNLYNYGGYYLELIRTLDRKQIAKVNHLPFSQSRLSYNPESGDVNGVWYSRNWAEIRKDRYKPKYIPLTEDGSDEARTCMYSFLQTLGVDYYPMPPFVSGLLWIEIQRQIAVFHLNNLENGCFPSFLIQFNNGQPDAEKGREMIRAIETAITGAKNTGKIIALFNDSKENAATFEPVTLSDADKQYEYWSSESRDMILQAHRITTPLLFGIRDGGGLGSNKDELAQGLQIFMEKVIDPMRKIITDDLREILKLEGIDAQVTFIQDTTEVTTTTDAAITTDKPADTSKADVSYNGAQISSAIDIIAKVKEGILTQEQAIVFLIQFLQLPVEVASSFFTGGDAVSKLRAYLGEEKKKICCSHEGQILSTELEAKFIEKFSTIGEQIDADEWELVDEQPAHDTSEDEVNAVKGWMETQLASESSYANGDKKSGEDSGLYKLRYAYGGEASEDSREFCKTMVSLTAQGLVFRYEDIEDMGKEEVNGKFAPAGQKSYDIFAWKGGVYCHHFWKRQIYFRKREGGKFLPNDGLKNDKRVGNVPYVKKKGFESVKPIDTPTRGSLKYS